MGTMVIQMYTNGVLMLHNMKPSILHKMWAGETYVKKSSSIQSTTYYKLFTFVKVINIFSNNQRFLIEISLIINRLYLIKLPLFLDSELVCVYFFSTHV